MSRASRRPTPLRSGGHVEAPGALLCRWEVLILRLGDPFLLVHTFLYIPKFYTECVLL